MFEQLVYTSPIVLTAAPVLLFSSWVPAGEPTVVPSQAFAHWDQLWNWCKRSIRGGLRKDVGAVCKLATVL